MKSANTFEGWLLAFMLTTLIGNSAAQAPPPQKPLAEPELKLPAILSAKPLIKDRNDDAMRKLLKARYNEALSEARDYYTYQKFASEHGPTLRSDPDHLYAMWQRVVHSGLELCDKPEEKVALLTAYLEVTRKAEKVEQERYEAGRCRIGDVNRAKYERLDVEIRLLRAKREPDKAKDK